jgi:quercetin dioxygenase-like cupin family protein
MVSPRQEVVPRRSGQYVQIIARKLSLAMMSTDNFVVRCIDKTDTLRVALVELRAGTTVDPTATASSATLHMLKGRLSVDRPGGAEEVGPGELLVFAQNLQQPLHELEDCSFLVTVAWEEGAGAWEQEEREGHH